MSAKRGKRVALFSVTVGVLVIGAVLLVFRDPLRRLTLPLQEEPSLSSAYQLPRSSGYSGQRVDIAQGAIPISEFSRFLADWTGFSVLVDSGISQKQIVVSSSIVDVDAELVRAILVSNGWTRTQATHAAASDDRTVQVPSRRVQLGRLLSVP